jgi:hypothetical protein
MVFADLGMSLDGFVAGANAGPDNALGDGGHRIHGWMYRLEAWRERLDRSGGEADNPDADVVQEKFDRSGAYVMGRRMFDEGEVGCRIRRRFERRSSSSPTGHAIPGCARAPRSPSSPTE